MNLSVKEFSNPFRPGAGHMPPYLAGREKEEEEFRELLEQEIILDNMILTGLRGIGKTVLLETFREIAIREGWLWVGTDLSESASVSEENLTRRLLTDLALVTSQIPFDIKVERQIGFEVKPIYTEQYLGFNTLMNFYEQTPGLVSDKLKGTIEYVWDRMRTLQRHKLIFAYDEAQNLSDNAEENEFPLSLLLDTFQSLQRKNIPFMIVLTGLPTLFPKLIEARTYTERMFRRVFLSQLDESDSRDAIIKPIEQTHCPIRFDEPSVRKICELSGGYPYFIQFICKEVYDVWVQKASVGESLPTIPVREVIQKLDSSFFAGRWARITDRQRELLGVIAQLKNYDSEFTVQEIVSLSQKILEKPFGSSQATQMLSALGKVGLIYKNRHGRYLFAVPMLGDFIRRQTERMILSIEDEE